MRCDRDCSHHAVGVQDPDQIIESLRAMKSESKNANLHFFTAMNGTHFSILAPINKLIAEKIASDSLESITEADINGALR